MHVRVAACASTLLVLGSASSLARPMTVLESNPAAQAVMAGPGTQFFIRFDGPVDHAGSALTIVQGDHVVETLRPRLNSQPNVLYGSARHLTPGDYELRWSAMSARDRDVSTGTIPFTAK